MRKGAGDLDPAILKPGDLANERGELTEILVLAENQSHIELHLMCGIKSVEGQTHIDSLFLAGQKRIE